MPTTARAADGVLQDNLTIPQGVAWQRSWSATDVLGAAMTLPNWSARAQIRAVAEDPTVLFEWNTSGGGPAATIGQIIIAGSLVTLLVSEQQSLAWTWRRGLYDLYLRDPNGAPTRLVKGSVIVTPTVTRG